MLAEYSYDKANKVLEFFKNAQIASLKVTKIDNAFVMDYTLIDECDKHQQVLAKKVLSESLPQRLKVINLLNIFIENQIIDNINIFSLSFNVIDVKVCELSCTHSLKDETKNTITIKQFNNCLEQLELLSTKLGIGTTKLNDILKKEKPKKYVPVTLIDIIQSIREISED